MIEVTVKICTRVNDPHGKVIGQLLIGRQIFEDTEVANYNFDLWKDGGVDSNVPMTVWLGHSDPTVPHSRRVAGKIDKHVRGDGVWTLIQACLNRITERLG